MTNLIVIIFSIIFLFLFQIECLKVADSMEPQKPQLIVISFDGFRYDSITEEHTPNLLKFRRQGVYAKHLTGVFPTKTFTNHISIATGLYPQYHGVMGNNIFDVNTEKEVNYSKELFNFSESVLPIWTLNELNGGTSGCIMWPGSEYSFKNRSCSYMIKYNSNYTMTSIIDTAIEWLTNKQNPANLIMIYIHQPDNAAHLYGYGSIQYLNQIKELDDMAGYLHDKTISRYLAHTTHIVFLSDHGMIDVNEHNIIDITKVLQPEGKYKIYSSSPVLQIVPENGQHSLVLETFRNFSQENRHFTAYDCDELLSRWHVNNSRIGPITLVADLGYVFQDVVTNGYNRTIFGMHGYDNIYSEMDGIFIGGGPFFQNGRFMEHLKSIDLFDTFCHILKIKNIPETNSSITRVNRLIYEVNQVRVLATFMGFFLLMILAIFIKISLMMVERRRPYVSWK